MSDEHARPAGREGFVHAVIRIVAVVLLAYAILHVVQYVIAFGTRGSSWWLGRGGPGAIERAIHLSHVSLILFLLAASGPMLKWKWWSRYAVMWWAALTVVISFASNAWYLLQNAAELSRAATQPIGDPLWLILIGQAFWWLHQAFLPVLIWLILKQPEAAKLFERSASGGFEVVPMARAMPLVNDGSNAARG